MGEYTFGRETAYSARVIIEQLGYDFAELSAMDYEDKFDFSIAIIPSVQGWFENFRTAVDAPLVARFILHALTFTE